MTKQVVNALVMIVGLVCAATTARALDTVQALLSECEQKTGTFDTGICRGYIAGISDWQMADRFICPKQKRITYGASQQFFINWAKKHPERWGEDGIDGVVAALQEAFPCKK